MKVIGLTGGIATGKSTAAKILEELGAFVISTDELARQQRKLNKYVIDEVREQIGMRVMRDKDTIDNKALRELAFRNPPILKTLETIIVPRVLEDVEWAVLKTKARKAHKAIVIESYDMLPDSPLYNLCDEIWVIVCDPKTQLRRLMARNTWAEDYAELRIKAQRPQEKLIKDADVVIDSTEEGSLEAAVRHFSLTLDARPLKDCL